MLRGAATMLTATYQQLLKAEEHCTRTLGWNRSDETGALRSRQEKEDPAYAILDGKSVSTDVRCCHRAIESKIENELEMVASRLNRLILRGLIINSNATLIENHMCVSSVSPRRQ